MVVAAPERSLLRQEPGGWWRLEGWADGRLGAGITDRHADPSAVFRTGGMIGCAVRAEQVHGASVAVIRHVPAPGLSIPGCDALVTDARGVALVISTADCLPVFVADPVREIVGLAHVGWRGLARGLPGRLVAVFRHTFGTEPRKLQVAIGPAIRACCYEVGSEVSAQFGAFVRAEAGRTRCDLIAAAAAQLLASGVAAAHIADAQRCTACEAEHWFSYRREGAATGRLHSWIRLRT